MNNVLIVRVIVRMYNIGAHNNHKLLSYHDNEPLRYDYHTIDIIAHLYMSDLYTCAL